MAWLSGGYYKRKKVTLTGGSSGAQTDYQMMFNVTHDSDMQADFDDLRFTKLDGTTLLDAWLESKIDSTSAVVWVKTDTPANTVDADIYMYYGNSGALSDWDGVNTFIGYDGFETYAEWTPHASNPLVSPGGSNTLNTWGSVWKEGSTYHMYYTRSTGSDHVIDHATSSDGLSWTKDTTNNPVLDHGSTGAWDDNRIWCPMVWKEGTTWYMIYSGDKSGADIQVGLATSSDGVNWTKEALNPVLATSAAGWDSAQAEGWGLIKVGSTYYLWYGTVSPTRRYGLATSTNLTSWTKDTANNPIFDNGRFCPDVFKYGSYYYLLIPHYTSGTDYTEFELYRDSNPTFYPADRTFIGVKKTYGTSGAWENEDEDTPWFLTNDITKTLTPSDDLWCYYGGANTSDVWCMGLLLETDIGTAVQENPINWTKDQPTNCTITSDSTVKKHGDCSYKFHDASSVDGPSIQTTDISKTSGGVGFWMRTTNSTGSGTEHFEWYGFENTSLKLAVGFNDATKKFCYWNGGYIDTATSYSVDTWYLIGAEFDCATDTFNFVVCDTSMTEVHRTDNISFGSVATVLNKIKTVATSGYQGDGYIDTFRVREYVANPATYAFGSEESAMIFPVFMSYRLRQMGA